MPHPSRTFRRIIIVCMFLMVAQVAMNAQTSKRMTIQATARGTSTQMGKMFNINLHIEQYSSAEDRKALLDAFSRSGQDGIVDVLTKMKAKGRISTPWGVGNEIKYIFELPSEKGRHLRLITDRRIAFGEAYNSTRSEEYSIAAVDLLLMSDGKSAGTLLPACKLTLNKNKQIEVESYQNPWELTNLIIYEKD